jgi:hypothetical protein
VSIPLSRGKVSPPFPYLVTKLINSGTLCASASCKQPIEGPCLLTQDRRYHPGHLNCDKSGCTSRMDEYYEIGNKRYCDRHVASVLAGPGLGVGSRRAEKRITRLVELPVGGFGL